MKTEKIGIKDCVSLLEYCDVPKRQCQEVSSLLSKIDISNLMEHDGVYLHGDAGTGKTLIAVKLMLDFLSESKHTKHAMKKLNVLNNEYDPYYAKSLRCLFVEIPGLLSNIRETFNQKRTRDYNEEQETEGSIIKKYSEVDFLVLDDLGVEKVTDWSFSVLYLIINSRYNNYKKTIITSNRTLDYLAEKLDDDRIPSRIRSMCTLVKMSGEDKRG